MRPRGPGFGRWGAVAAVGAIAAALPFIGAWASADRKPDPEPAAERRPPEPRPASPRPVEARQARAPSAPSRPPTNAPAIPRRVAMGAYVVGGTSHPSLLRRYARITGHRPAILMYYRPWRKPHRRKLDTATFDQLTLRRVADQGAIPMITWEPGRTSLRDIGSGRLDGHIRLSARRAGRFRRQILLRFAHEMNGDWYSWGSQANSPRTYIRAWRRVVRIFREEGARHVRFVWTPNADSENLDRIRRLYPGDAWVDWVGLSGFSWGGPWDWVGARDIFEASYRTVTRVTKKPFMIAETGVGELGGDKAKWIEWTFEKDLPRMRRVRAVVWFNGKEQWADFGVDSTRRSLRAFRAAVASSRYSGTTEDILEAGGDR